MIKESTIQSKQMGKRENKVINIDGRVQLDLLQVHKTRDKMLQLRYSIYCYK